MINREIIEHTIIFRDDIFPDPVQDLMDKMSMFPFVNLHFSTDGGELHTMYALVAYLNRRYEQESVRVYLDDICVSAGTFLLTDYNGPLFIQPTFRYFYFHAPDFLSYKIRKDENDERLRDILDVHNETYYQKLSKEVGLTKSQVNRIRNGKHVHIFADELDNLSKVFVTDDFFETRTSYVPFSAPKISTKTPPRPHPKIT